ncbi:hypothetical protein HK102_006864 [Quaeritorhiza haematococci]|nr:hypothetical protein HK102_006864 [Quaeritorhiza haematococci]
MAASNPPQQARRGLFIKQAVAQVTSTCIMTALVAAAYAKEAKEYLVGGGEDHSAHSPHSHPVAVDSHDRKKVVMVEPNSSSEEEEESSTLLNPKAFKYHPTRHDSKLDTDGEFSAIVAGSFKRTESPENMSGRSDVEDLVAGDIVDLGIEDEECIVDEDIEDGQEVMGMSVKPYIERYGFEFEEHQVVTKDEFYLVLHRVTKPGVPKEQLKGPILLMHGLFQSSGVFVTSGRHNSLAFYLADRGYDVWMGNNRCVEKRHVRYTANDVEFWDWSLDELGEKDFPCLIDGVLEKTGKEKLVYIGHSQGNAQAFHGLSLNPEISGKLKCLIALAPAVYLGSLLK